MGTTSSSSSHGPEVVIVAAKRTPHGAFGGALKDWTATDLAVAASQAALAQLGPLEANVRDVDWQVLWGNVAQTSADAAYLARHVGLRAGLPQGVPALTLNRLCGSGFQAVISAAEQIRLGYADAVLCGGTESMSQSPHMLRGARWGAPLGKPPAIEDSLWSALTDSYAGLPMGMTAENLAERYHITRERSDLLSLRSQQRWAAADEAGRFREELVPLTLKGGKGTEPVQLTRDEHPRPQTTLAALTGLKPVFKPAGVVTAGSASGISDGAAALIVASRATADRLGWTPLARVIGWGIVGCDPAIMGIGPAGAIVQLLERTKLSLEQVDLLDINEAFSAQVLAVLDELGLAAGTKSAAGTTGLDQGVDERVNVDGGAVALGHPLGASGARITAHLAYELRRRKASRAIGAACIGGGQGIAIAIEAV
jgi:acetyl-CoA C-acetyltransferase/acetyl-CoA acyltransferase 2